MALTSTTWVTNTQWGLVNQVSVDYPAATEAGSMNFSLGNLDYSIWNAVYVANFSLAGSGATTIDLTSLTNLVGVTFSFAHVLNIQVLTGDYAATYSPGASNGLTWFLGGTTPTMNIKANGCFFHSDSASSTGTVVDGTHKTITITNLGAGTNIVKVIILGSTL